MIGIILTRKELLGTVYGLNGCASKSLSTIKATYALGKIKKKAIPELEEIEAARLALMEKHKDATDGGKDIEAEYTAFLSEPIALSGCRALTLDELEGAGLTVDELASLGPFVTIPAGE